MLHAPDNRKGRHATKVADWEVKCKRLMFNYKSCLGDMNSIAEVWYSDGGFSWSEEELAMMGREPESSEH